MMSCGGSRLEARTQKGDAIESVLRAWVIRLRVSYTQNDETRRRNSLVYMSKANFRIALTY